MTSVFLETSIKKIKEASENNKLVIFVGAGVSANSGIPTWGQLVEEFSKELGVEVTSDLYLKIPQYYFNERGEKEYSDKLNEIFHQEKYKINPIHKEIFKLKPQHIITTNYDTLLEEAAIEEGEFFHTVKHNLDLPYANLDKMIIKMHGDFENRNIVLKEDDYLNYSKNFMLIETYIKSLIATNTVLFIGYSVNDTNFNLIFQWVKNILNNHFQPAYLLETSRNHSNIEHSYYKNRGINILYSEDLKDIPANNMFENEKGNQLYDTLSYFNNYDVMKGKDALEEIYEKINHLSNLEFIMPSQILKSLDLKHVLYSKGMLDITGENNILSEVFSNYEDYKTKHRDEMDKIIDLFKRANINGVTIRNKTIFRLEETATFIEQKLREVIDDSVLAHEFNYGTNIMQESNYAILFKRAIAYSKLENFSEAYQLYKMISLKAFQEKKYMHYYLAEFNRKHLVRYWEFNGEIPTQILKEADQINLTELYDRLPFKIKKSMFILKEVGDFSFIYRVQSELDSITNGLKDNKNTIENGGWYFSNNLTEISNEIINIMLFIKVNNLYIDHYTEIKRLYMTYLEGIFASYSTKYKKSNQSFANFKVKEIGIFETYLIITKLTKNDFTNLFRNYKLTHLKVKQNSFEYIGALLEDTVENIIRNNQVEQRKQYLENMIRLLTKIKLDEEYANIVVEKLLELVTSKDDIKYWEILNHFMMAHLEQNLISQHNVLRCIEIYIQLYLTKSNFLLYNATVNFNGLIYMYKNGKINKNLIEEIINKKIRNKDYRYSCVSIAFIGAPLYKVFPKKYKKRMATIIENLLLDMEQSSGFLAKHEIECYYASLANNIIKNNRIINKKIIKTTLHEIETKKVKYSTEIDRNLRILASLCRQGFLEKKELDKYKDEFKGFSSYFDFLFNVNSLGEVEKNIVSSLGSMETEKLMKSSHRKKIVYQAIEKELGIDNEINKFFLENFYEKKF